MGFASWLYAPEPEWKQKLETCDPHLFEELEELGIKKDDLTLIMEKLEEYNIL